MTAILSYFKDTYEESRESFISIGRTIGGELLSHKIADLAFESLYLPPASGRKENLLILSSGIHGIEGYAGSALQRYFMQNNFLNVKEDNTGILIIHGINPYGFKHKRRVTERNIDLNRNFDTTKDLFLTENSGYDQVYNFLNPKKRISRPQFFASAVYNILKYGVNSLRRAILRGQYKFPEGLFFGGKDFEPQVSIIKDLLERVGQGYEKVLLVDLHTGYGKRGKLHLFGNTSPFIDQNFMDKIFKGLSVDYGEEKDFYAVTGGFTVFLAKLFHQKSKYAGICFEFGTIDSQKLSGSLESLYRMINEDKDLFTELFYPSDPEWRKTVTSQFEENIKVICHNLMHQTSV